MVILFLLAKVVLFSESHSFYRSSHRRCSVKEGVLRNFAKNTGKYLCESLFFNNVAGLCNFIKKEALAQVFSCEFCEIFKTPFFKEHIWQLLILFLAEMVPLNEKHSLQCKHLLSVEAAVDLFTKRAFLFTGSHSFLVLPVSFSKVYYFQQRTYFLVETITFNESHFFQWNAFFLWTLRLW